jgi:hypothetical protein
MTLFQYLLKGIPGNDDSAAEDRLRTGILCRWWEPGRHNLPGMWDSGVPRIKNLSKWGRSAELSDPELRERFEGTSFTTGSCLAVAASYYCLFEPSSARFVFWAAAQAYARLHHAYALIVAFC